MPRISAHQINLGFLLVLAFLSPITMAQVAVAPTTPVSYLFVEDAEGGAITGPDDQHLTLKLTRVRNYVTAFSDRPIRKAEALPNDDFVYIWPRAFAGAPPNAVLSYRLPGQPQPINIVLTLTHPQYDSKNKTLSFEAVRILQTLETYYINSYINPSVKAVATPKRFGSASLFIDASGNSDNCLWCN